LLYQKYKTIHMLLVFRFIVFLNPKITNQHP
jgi:hypothetical protein